MPENAHSLFSTPALESLKLAMHGASRRHVALASNIANVNTPGYRRVDITPAFHASLDQALRALREGGQARPITVEALGPDTAASPPRMDGNNVRMDHEVTELMNNSATYEMAARLLAKQYGAVRTAITGRANS